MHQLKHFINSPHLGLLMFRVTIGLTMAFAHGLGKIPPPEQFVGWLGSMNFPLPLVLAWAAAIAEFGCALLIVVGLYTRHAALMLIVTMGVAFFVAHASDPFKVKEMALLYLISFVLLFFQGAGNLSLDRKIRKA